MKLQTVKKEHWIKIERGDETAEFLVSPMSSKESFALIEDSTTVKYKRGMRDEKTDLYKLKISRIVRVIKDWKGIEDSEGNPLPCTPQNLETAYNFNQSLIDEVLDRTDALGESEEQAKDDEVKNSKAGSVGSANPA